MSIREKIPGWLVNAAVAVRDVLLGAADAWRTLSNEYGSASSATHAAVFLLVGLFLGWWLL